MQDPVYNRIESTRRPSLFAASGFVLLAAAGLWLSALLELALPRNASALLINLVYYLPFMALPIALYALRRPDVAGALRLNPPSPMATLSLVLLAVLSMYVASALAAAWEFALNALGLRSPGGVSLPRSEGELALAVVGMAALPALCEEFLFRGFVLSAWEGRGTAFAIGVTAALFALLHGNLYGLPAYLLVGAVAGFVTFALDSIYAGVVYHTVYNAACLIIPWLLMDEAETASETVVTVSDLISVGLQVAFMAGMMALLLASLWARARNSGIEPIPRVRRPLEGRDRAMLWAALIVMAASIVVVQVLAAMA